MIVVFDAFVTRRLAEIEAAEGVPDVELVRQAVGLWVLLEEPDRRAISLYGMHLALTRLTDDGDGGRS